jgi:hypothetical protein
MVFNATFNNISAISWLSVLLVEETGVTGENHRPATNKNVADKFLSRNVCIEYTLTSAGFEFTTLVVIGIDCINSTTIRS